MHVRWTPFCSPGFHLSLSAIQPSLSGRNYIFLGIITQFSSFQLEQLVSQMASSRNVLVDREKSDGFIGKEEGEATRQDSYDKLKEYNFHSSG